MHACIKSFKSILELCEFIELLTAKIMVNDGQPSRFDIYSCKTINNIKNADINGYINGVINGFLTSRKSSKNPINKIKIEKNIPTSE